MTGRFKKIFDRTDDELVATIERAKLAASTAGFDFWEICAGVDAYQEQRRRKMATTTIKPIPLVNEPVAFDD